MPTGASPGRPGYPFSEVTHPPPPAL